MRVCFTKSKFQISRVSSMYQYTLRSTMIYDRRLLFLFLPRLLNIKLIFEFSAQSCWKNDVRIDRLCHSSARISHFGNEIAPPTAQWTSRTLRERMKRIRCSQNCCQSAGLGVVCRSQLSPSKKEKLKQHLNEFDFNFCSIFARALGNDLQSKSNHRAHKLNEILALEMA